MYKQNQINKGGLQNLGERDANQEGEKKQTERKRRIYRQKSGT
jgi:hypothetical protein